MLLKKLPELLSMRYVISGTYYYCCIVQYSLKKWNVVIELSIVVKLPYENRTKQFDLLDRHCYTLYYLVIQICMELPMLAVRLPPDLDNQLTLLAEETGHNKSYYVKRAIANFLEDHADYCIAVSRLEENLPSIDLNEVKKQLGIDE